MAYFQIWRLITSFFVNLGFLGLVISCLMVWYVSQSTEIYEGTARTLLKFLYYHLVVQIFYTIFGALVIGLIFGEFKILSSGIWPVYFVFLTLRCLQNPD